MGIVIEAGEFSPVNTRFRYGQWSCCQLPDMERPVLSIEMGHGPDRIKASERYAVEEDSEPGYPGRRFLLCSESEGNVYAVTCVGGVTRCTCTGFGVHGHCKHAVVVPAALAAGAFDGEYDAAFSEDDPEYRPMTDAERERIEAELMAERDAEIAYRELSESVWAEFTGVEDDGREPW